MLIQIEPRKDFRPEIRAAIRKCPEAADLLKRLYRDHLEARAMAATAYALDLYVAAHPGCKPTKRLAKTLIEPIGFYQGVELGLY